MMPGLDLGTTHGACALVDPRDLAAVPTVLRWADAQGSTEARGMLLRLVQAGEAGRAWYAEQPFVLASRPGAGAAQYRALADWSRTAGACGAEIVEVPVADWRRDYGVPGHAAARCSRAWAALLWSALDRGAGDHVSDACLLSLRATPGGVAWALDQLAAWLRAGDERAQAVYAAQRAPRRRARADVTQETVARLPPDVREYLELRAAAGDVRAVRALERAGR